MSFSAFKNQFKQKEFSYQLLSDNIYTDICGGLHWPADVLVRRWCNVGISCSPLDKWFRTYSSSSETQQDTLLLTGLLLIGVLCSLFRKVWKLLFYLSGTNMDVLMYWIQLIQFLESVLELRAVSP